MSVKRPRGLRLAMFEPRPCCPKCGSDLGKPVYTTGILRDEHLLFRCDWCSYPHRMETKDNQDGRLLALTTGCYR